MWLTSLDYLINCQLTAGMVGMQKKERAEWRERKGR